MVFGQPSLQSLPTPSEQPSRTVVAYAPPAALKSERKSLSGSKAGIEVFKVGKNGKLHSRRVALSSNNRCILVTSNKIKSIKGLFKKALAGHQEATARSIDIGSVERIAHGQQTDRFLMARSLDKLPHDNENNGSKTPSENKDDETHSLSIIYRVSTSDAASLDLISAATSHSHNNKSKREAHRFDTLDLLVPKKDDYHRLISTLEELMEIYEEERKHWDPFSLFLQFHWADVGKEFHRESRLSCSEWAGLCDRANIPMTKELSKSYFREFAQERGIAEEKGLTLMDTADLMTEVRDACTSNVDDSNEQDHPLMDVWNDLIDSDPVPSVKYESASSTNDLELAVNTQEESISNVAFLSFVRSQQKEFSTTLDDVRTLVDVLNKQKSLENTNDNEELKERLGRSRFLAYLTSDANDIFDPAKGQVGADDMDQPLTNYWINTSHDTYLAKLPNSFRVKDVDMERYHTVTVQSYANALHRGARCLELDIFDGLYGFPVVSRRKPTSPSENQSIPFVQVLQLVRSFLRSNPKSYPIILFLETHCSMSNQMLIAEDLKHILDSEGMLYHPPLTILNNAPDPLPSPNALRGKVILKNKRPKIMRDGGFVFNDDFDDENTLPLQDLDQISRNVAEEDDDDEEDDIRGVVVRFEASGPIRSEHPDAPRHSPSILLDIARHDAHDAKLEADRAERKELEAISDASFADELAESLIAESGLSVEQVKSRAIEENQSFSDDDDENALDLIPSFSVRSEESIDDDGDEGMEVQDFFGRSVEGARSEYSEADAHATSASQDANQDLERLTEATNALKDAEGSLEASYQLEKQKAIEAKKAAADARANREHADIAKQRVDTVKRLLRNSKDSAASAETVVVTAMTEAKISEQRASETEARASRALGVAEKERKRGDAETEKEELLEHEAADLHETCLEATRVAKVTRERLEKAASMLDRVNEQIKLIERSAQFQKELNGQETKNNYSNESSNGSPPRHGGNFLAKHAAKLQERQVCTRQIKEASVANQSAEMQRKRTQSAFEEKAHMWKMQSEIASQCRKQADRSSQHAEELAEHAEEEREAAILRHIARVKAQKGVSQSDDYQSSIQAQLVEASHASEEAASLALESRVHADKVAREAEYAKDHTKALEHVENMAVIKDEAQLMYRESMGKKAEADSSAVHAKRLLETSSEVFTNAKRDAAAEVNNTNARRQLEREAVQAFRKALIARKLVESASLQSKVMKEAVVEKTAAESRAEEYKLRMDKRVPIASNLAVLTLLNSTRFSSWEKSRSLPSCNMHSIVESRVTQMLEDDEETHRENFTEFTRDHFVRTFPSYSLVTENEPINRDPTTAHGLGCQMVSMNFHSSDEHLLLNDGRFRANGSSGYVLKPLRLTDGATEHSQRWRFTILCGNYLPKGEAAMAKKSLSAGGSMQYVSPFVRVSLYDGTLNSQESPTIHETEPAPKNGLSPVWNEEDEFDIEITNPSIAILMFTVADHKAGEFVAGAALPASGLRQGYRSVALFDSLHSRTGPYSYASLVVRAQKLS